ncbi:S8 family serine peptidase [Haladaptatus sp. SPP-AMP-3]|uniref:S8 family serine peptidase n=1 Tax=Haladaptatus sp. SPP-AMP-3 TaxID=3121295 RepID=UPI003C2C56D0
MAENGTQFDRRSFLKLTGSVGATAAVSGITAATPGREPGSKENELLVGVSPAGGSPTDVVQSHLPTTAQIVHSNDVLGYVAVQIPDNDSVKQRFSDVISKNKYVKYVEENVTYSTSLTPNDPKYSTEQYAPQMVNADTAWDTTTGSSSVTIAVIDTGVQYNHPDLQSNFGSNPGKDFVDDDSDPYPDRPSDENHGTHVSGIAAAETNNGTGVAGISESKIINGRALDETGFGSVADIADAVQWATDQGADVINMSLGGSNPSDTMRNAVSYAYNRGVFISAAAGNSSKGSVDYPAGYDECLAVSALDSDGSFAQYSNYGPKVELTAPGTWVYSTTTASRGNYETLSGTSMATPVVSGVAGLALAQWNATNRELRAHLKNTAVDIGLPSSQQGSGRVDAQNVVTSQPPNFSRTADRTKYSGPLTDYLDSACHSHTWKQSNPSQVIVELLISKDSADFDLYVNEGRTTCPTTNSYDHRSKSLGSIESVTIDDPDTSTDLHTMADSWRGGGSYEIVVTEYTA